MAIVMSGKHLGGEWYVHDDYIVGVSEEEMARRHEKVAEACYRIWRNRAEEILAAREAQEAQNRMGNGEAN